MAVRWPLALPQYPQSDGYRRSLPNNMIRSSMDTGSDKVRKRGRFRPQVVTATYFLNPRHVYNGAVYNQRDVLESFIHNSIAEGAICFDWWHPELRRLVRARLKAGSDSLFDIQPVGNSLWWQATLTLEIWPDVKA